MWRREIIERAKRRSVLVTARRLKQLAALHGAKLSTMQAREELDWLEEEAVKQGLTVVKEAKRGRPRKLYLAPKGVNPFLDASFLEGE